MEMNKNLYRAEYRGKQLRLSRRNFELLEALVSRPLCVKSRGELLDIVDPAMTLESYDRAIDQRIKHIRKGLRRVWGENDWLVTCYGAGYYWEPAGAPKPEAPPPTYEDEHVAGIPPTEVDIKSVRREDLFRLWKNSG